MNKHLLLSVDALRANNLGQYGYERDTMPVLQRFVEDGVLFKEAYSNATLTRISIPAIHTSYRLAHDSVDSLQTIAECLNEADCATGCIGTKTGFKKDEAHFGFQTFTDLGRDDFTENKKKRETRLYRLDRAAVDVLGRALKSHPRVKNSLRKVYNKLPSPDDPFQTGGYTSAKEVTDNAIDWLTRHGDDDFFLWLHYMEGHVPYGIHDEHPFYTTPAPDERIYELKQKSHEQPDELTIAEHEKLIDLYDSDLRYCSQHIERLIRELEERDLWSELNVVFTADHGEEFHDHGLYSHRNIPHDELLHVPLIVRSPEQETGEIEETRELIDIAPTILDLHDVPIPDSFEGQNLFNGEERRVLSTGGQIQDGPVVAGRWDGYKYIYTVDGEYLFDLEADPLEEMNIASERPEVCSDTGFREDIPDRYFGEEAEAEVRQPEDDLDRQRLVALGYLDE